MMDVVSSAVEDESDVNRRVAHAVHRLRRERGLSLEALAARSGVSRSMISLVERGEASATAVVLDKLATGLDVALSSLFDAPSPAAGPVSRHADQQTWRDPGSGYVRRNVSPVGYPSPIRIVAVEFPPQARVAYETAERDTPIHQQVWVRAGEVEVTVGDDVHRLGAGDCVAFALDRPVVFHNPGDTPARYAVVQAGRQL
jgi:transcriptional regulator with XRE-family HTH domain